MIIRVAFAVSLLLIVKFGQRIREAETGDIAAGVVILEDRQQLRLDATPCKSAADKTIIVFTPPYKKIPLDKITCSDGKTYVRVQVIKNGSGR